MTKYKLIILSVISFILIGNSIKFKFDIVDNFITFANILLAFQYLKVRKSFFQYLASYILLIFIFLSLNLYAFGDFIGLMGEFYNFSQKKSLAIFGNNIIFCFFIGSFLFKGNYKNYRSNYIDANLRAPFSHKLLNIFIIFAFILSIISYILGIGKLGSQGVQLPFKLSGIIIMIRTDIVPVFLMIIVARNYKDPRLKIYLIIFFIWALFETFITLSKSRLVFTFLPAIIYYIFREQKINKKLIKSLLPIMAVFFLLYPIIGAMRYINSNSVFSLSAIRESKQLHDDMEGSNNENGIRIQFYNRTFLAGQHYMNAYNIFKDEGLFNFSRLPLIVLLGGSAVYETRIVEGFPETAIHSSGTTGITDPLLLGGRGLSYLSIFLFTFLASIIDNPKLNKKLLFKVFFLLIFISIIQVKSYSLFLDVLIIPFLACKCFEYYLISKSYRKASIIHTNKYIV